MHSAVDEAVATVAPLIAIGLAGVESGQDSFVDQRRIFDDLLRIPNWDLGGLTIVVRLPHALAFVYHSLHGAVAVDVGHLDTALSLATMSVSTPEGGKPEALWLNPEFVGWPTSLRRNHGSCTETWRFISDAFSRWSWLVKAFGDDQQYRVALSAYHMALSILEFASWVSSGQAHAMQSGKHADLDVPLCFMSENREVKEKAFDLFLRDRAGLDAIWRAANVDPRNAEGHWEHWLARCDVWMRQVWRLVRQPVAYAELWNRI